MGKIITVTTILFLDEKVKSKNYDARPKLYS